MFRAGELQRLIRYLCHQLRRDCWAVVDTIGGGIVATFATESQARHHAHGLNLGR